MGLGQSSVLPIRGSGSKSDASRPRATFLTKEIIKLITIISSYTASSIICSNGVNYKTTEAVQKHDFNPHPEKKIIVKKRHSCKRDREGSSNPPETVFVSNLFFVSLVILQAPFCLALLRGYRVEYISVCFVRPAFYDAFIIRLRRVIHLFMPVSDTEFK